MKLLTKPIREKLIANGKAQDKVRGTEDEIDFEPVVKLFNPCGAWHVAPHGAGPRRRPTSHGASATSGWVALRSAPSRFPSWRACAARSASGSSERDRSLDAEQDPHGLCPRSLEVWMHCCVSWSAVAAWSARPGATVSVPKRSVCVRDRMQGKKHSETESDILFQVRLRPIADVTAVPDKCMVFAASN
jgi:hypothetical protein